MSAPELTVAYYGYAFDASGYGHAARAYVHALHLAGVRLTVTDLAANRARQVSDPLVSSLVGPPGDPDLHLFHGIPPQWARLAFSRRNGIGMTVWETSAMPSQWRNPLNQVREVWVPSAFNAQVFAAGLESPVFTLPHPIFPPHANGDVPDPGEFLGVSGDDFVFYSILAWQDRKGPHEMIDAFLRSCGGRADAVYVIKTDRGAAAVARCAVDEALGRAGVCARILVRPEGWSDAEIEALHRRGDCYLSLHRGEGWNYPLFEAASRGTPVIATGYSGPLDYLDPAHHALVRFSMTPVRQPYLYYNPRMTWAAPDVGHAAELIRAAYEQRDTVRQRAVAASATIRERFSLDAIGASARNRMIALLKRTNPDRHRTIVGPMLAPPGGQAIPPTWYDEDYFETGVKSNWHDGYRWGQFAGLFTELAGTLDDVLDGAASYLDVGCAKGFLVRALRERGRDAWGFDGSSWAIDHADPTARPYLTLASVDDATFDRRFDVIVATDVLQTLTPAQIDALLRQARAWASTAIVAIIPSFGSTTEEAAFVKRDNDPSAITMRTRDWWHERFLAAGWRQDALHRALARQLQRRPQVERMGWCTYLYAP